MTSKILNTWSQVLFVLEIISLAVQIIETIRKKIRNIKTKLTKDHSPLDWKILLSEVDELFKTTPTPDQISIVIKILKYKIYNSENNFTLHIIFHFQSY